MLQVLQGKRFVVPAVKKQKALKEKYKSFGSFDAQSRSGRKECAATMKVLHDFKKEGLKVSTLWMSITCDMHTTV